MKNFALVLILAIAGAFVVWTVMDKSGDDAAEQTNVLLEYVPADTIYYMGSKGRQELLEFYKNAPVSSSTPSQAQAFDLLLEEIEGAEEAWVKFLRHLLKEYHTKTDGSWGSVAAFTGIGGDSGAVIYSHGAFPVIRIELADPQKIHELVKGAIQESGWTPQVTPFADESGVAHEVLLWDLPETEKDKIHLQIALANINSVLTLTLIQADEPQQAKLERLGLKRPVATLDAEVAALQADYGFSDEATGFVHIERIVKGILDPQSNAFGQHIKSLQELKGDVRPEELAACRQEFGNLVESMPRVVMGAQRSTIEGDRMNMLSSVVLELKNEMVKQELVKLRGHLPAHTLTSSDKLFALGYGFNVDSLAPVLTTLWSDFTQRSFECPKLVMAQEKMKQQNPGMLALGTAMIGGAQGVGLSVYDIQLSTASAFPEKVSALMTLSTKNPASLAALAQNVPMLAGLVIPTDGQAVDLPLPLPPTYSVKAAIKGQHLAIFTGDVQAQVDALVNETLDANGVLSMSVDYERFSEVFNQIDLSQMGVGGEACTQQQEIKQMFRDLNMAMDFTMDFVPAGLTMDAQLSMGASESKPLSLPGAYKVELLNDSCQWEVSGKELINLDGSGSYTEMDKDGACDLYSSEYKWSREGIKYVMDISADKSRESCADEWELSDFDQDVCYLLNIEEKTFQCMFSPGTDEASVYRYTRM